MSLCRTAAKVKAVLTDDQKTKLDACKRKMRERRESEGMGRLARPATAIGCGLSQNKKRGDGSKAERGVLRPSCVVRALESPLRVQ